VRRCRHRANLRSCRIRAFSGRAVLAPLVRRRVKAQSSVDKCTQARPLALAARENSGRPFPCLRIRWHRGRSRRAQTSPRYVEGCRRGHGSVCDARRRPRWLQVCEWIPPAEGGGGATESVYEKGEGPIRGSSKSVFRRLALLLEGGHVYEVWRLHLRLRRNDGGRAFTHSV